jgi:hypothetical protein
MNERRNYEASPIQAKKSRLDRPISLHQTFHGVFSKREMYFDKPKTQSTG